MSESERSTQSIIDGLNQGSLVTESIKKQQAEIMSKMEETVKAAQQKIRNIQYQFLHFFVIYSHLIHFYYFS